MKEFKKRIIVSIGLLVAFVLWTIAVCFVDVHAIGPQSSSVGLATINECVHNFTGVNLTLYTITDWLGLVPFAVCIGFGVLGLVQLIKRKSLLKVDKSLFILGGFYIVVILVYIFFEGFVINYRPVLIDNVLEVSYPSSTTMLVMCVMPTTVFQLNERIKNKVLKYCVSFIIISYTAFMVIGRLISGVHWVTDIIGGALLSSGLVMMYYSISAIVSDNN